VSVPYSLELGIEDWLDFINALDSLRVNEWEIVQRSFSSFGDGGYRHGSAKLKVFTLNSNKSGIRKYCVGDIEIREISQYIHFLPPNWDEFKKIIINMEEKVDGVANEKDKYE
jgi:hypothetical protein